MIRVAVCALFCFALGCKPLPGAGPDTGGVSADDDGDGYAAALDCDDADAAIHPFAAEDCGPVDRDCDGAPDGAAADAVDVYADADGDGFGADLLGHACAAGPGEATTGGDCDDDDARYHPGAEESDCTDPEDYDCDGVGAAADGDGDGTPTCLDCDDEDAAVHPGAVEVCNHVDDDCDDFVDNAAVDAPIWYRDADGDEWGDAGDTVRECEAPTGYVEGDGDCEDGDAAVSPDATETCDGIDDDCDGDIDEDDAADAGTWYLDLDGDSYGDPLVTETACAPSAGYVANADDCNDAVKAVNPAATEVCDGVDNDCKDGTDVGASDASTWYYDADADGYGLTATTKSACTVPSGYAASSGDCSDTDAAVHPGASEKCNSKDDDCDGTTDESSAIDASTWYADSDGDTYGSASSSTVSCAVPSGYVADKTDCNDASSAVHPGATETCNSVDDDCDGTTDPTTSSDAATWYRDADADTYGTSGTTTKACSKPSGYVATSTDCDDADATAYPGATEVCDLNDEDCDGSIDEGTTRYWLDADNDAHGVSTSYVCSATTGYTSAASDDCDDADKYVYPGATEICDGQFNNCTTSASWTASSEDGLLSYEATDGTFTATSYSGTSSSPTLYSLPTSGTGHICGGTWYMRFTGAGSGTFSIVGERGSASTIVDANNTGVILTSTGGTLNVEGLTFKRGKSTSTTGAVYATAGTVNATDMVFTSNTGIYGGAVLFLTGAGGSFTDVDFTSNTATYGGGAFFDDADVTLDAALFDGNTASASGGGIFTQGGANVEINDSTFSNNDANGSTGNGGGGVYMTGATTIVQIAGSSFSGNGVSNDGGGLLVANGTASVSSSTFTTNTSSDDGGGLAIYSGSLGFTSSTVSDNSGDEGGGLYVLGGSATCTGSSASASYGILHNSASASSKPGGGVRLVGGTFTGVSCDFGTAASSDNSPQDVYADKAYNYGSDKNVVCTTASCI